MPTTTLAVRMWAFCPPGAGVAVGGIRLCGHGFAANEVGW